MQVELDSKPEKKVPDWYKRFSPSNSSREEIMFIKNLPNETGVEQHIVPDYFY